MISTISISQLRGILTLLCEDSKSVCIRYLSRIVFEVCCYSKGHSPFNSGPDRISCRAAKWAPSTQRSKPWPWANCDKNPKWNVSFNRHVNIYIPQMPYVKIKTINPRRQIWESDCDMASITSYEEVPHAVWYLVPGNLLDFKFMDFVVSSCNDRRIGTLFEQRLTTGDQKRESSVTCVITTTRGLFELTLGKRHNLRAISQMSDVWKWFSVAKLNAAWINYRLTFVLIRPLLAIWTNLVMYW